MLHVDVLAVDVAVDDPNTYNKHCVMVMLTQLCVNTYHDLVRVDGA